MTTLCKCTWWYISLHSAYAGRHCLTCCTTYSKTCVREPPSRLTLNSGWCWKSCLSYKGTCHVILLAKLHDMYLYKTTTFPHQPIRSISTVAVLHRFYCISILTLTLLLLNTTCSVLANSVDPDQLASSEANWSGSALFVIKYVNFNQKPGSSNLIGWKLKVGVTF